MLEVTIGLGVVGTLGIAVLVGAVWHRLRREDRLWRSMSAFDDELHRPEVLGFAVIRRRGRNRYAKFLTMNDASDPMHDDLAIVIRLRPNGNRYAIVDEKLVHFLDMTVATLVLNDYDDGRYASILKSYKRNKYHDEMFVPLIEKAFKDE